jgi:CspA family cold shock protein
MSTRVEARPARVSGRNPRAHRLQSGMLTSGVVRFWDDEAGWGIIDSPATPGGCWAHFSAIVARGYRRLRAGQQVLLDWEQADQDGYAFRAISVRIDDRPAQRPANDPVPQGGYSSALELTFDRPDEPD